MAKRPKPPLSPNNGQNKKDEEIHVRWNYVDHSLKFVDWVNRLGVERTLFGRWAYLLDHHLMIRKVVMLFLFVFCLAFLVTFEFDFGSNGYHTGDIAASHIKSPVTVELVDELETRRRQAEAEHSVPPVFDLDLRKIESQVNRIYLAFRDARKWIAEKPWPKNASQREERIKELLSFQGRFEEKLGGVHLPTRAFEWLIEQRFGVRIENILIRATESFSDIRLVDGIDTLGLKPDDRILVRSFEENVTTEERYMTASSVKDRSSFLQGISLDNLNGWATLTPFEQTQVLKLTQAILPSNLIYNEKETRLRQDRSRDQIAPIQLALKKGQTVVSAGTTLTEGHIQILNRLQQLKSEKNRDFLALIVAVMLVTVVLVFGSYLRRFTLNRVNISFKDLTAMAAITLVVVALGRVILFLVGGALEDRLGVSIPPSALSYVLPTASASMLVGLLITSGEIVWIYSVFVAAVMGLMTATGDSFLLVSIVSGIAGARGVFKCKKRNDVYLAGLRVGAINVVMIAVVTLVSGNTVTTDLANTLGWNLSAGFASGILSSFIALMLVPFFESAFNYTTDVRLLELSNLDHPLLKEMIVRAPGTYHHSLVVGSMAEAAAEEIGANPLLAKVSSYYHDIGKTAHAQYFIENQKPGVNPHDHLSPHLSKTVLIAHVKDGVELAVEHKLGRPIIDVILQHHGTTLISFFYNKAKELQGEGDAELSEEDFRYPGPKPQTREAALCMLADSIEAAARSLDEPTPIRLQNIVKNIIHRKFMDGQLEECNLTLRDLSQIERSFILVLLGIYHQRIDYPKEKGGGAADRPPS